MRVHALTVTAFGPYADTVQVDLDALSRDGLFLLCGATGAGKTSLLDAIVFALYGRVPGARGQEKRLRSDHASASVRTEVVCEVTLRGERVRITRRPEQIRPKARGTGTTKEQARLHVQRRVASGWEPVSIRLDEGGEFLKDQIGLSAEQFWQVVLLPQGEFAEFLRAEPDQRAKLLDTLFDTRRFADAEDWLAEHARAARAALADAEESVDRLLHRVEQAVRGLSGAGTGAEFPGRPASEDAAEARAYVASQLARAGSALRVAAAEDASSTVRLAAAEAGRDRGRRSVRAVDRFLTLRRHQDSLAARSEQLAADRSRLAVALAAEPLRPFLDAAATRRDRCDAAAAVVLRAYLELVDVDVDAERPVRLRPIEDGHGGDLAADDAVPAAAVPAATVPAAAVPAAAEAGTAASEAGTAADPTALDLVTVSGQGRAETVVRRWCRALLDEVARLTELEAVRATVEADEARLIEIDERRSQTQLALAELTTVSERLPAALVDLAARRDAARVSAAGIEHTSLALDTAQSRVAAANRAKELGALVARAEAEQARTYQIALDAKAAWLLLRETRLAGIAAELAEQLAEGKPCPVCGSAEHPAPAQRSESAVTAADERVAADLQDRLEAEADLAAANLAELRQDLGGCRALITGSSLATLRKDLAAAQRADGAARNAAELLPQLISEHADLVSGGSELTDQMAQLGAAMAVDAAAAAGLGAGLAAGRRRLDKARGPDVSLLARRTRLVALAEAAESVGRTWSAHDLALTAAEESREALRDRLQRNDFGSSEAAQAALLEDAARAELAAALRDHEDSQTGVSAELISASADLDAALSDLLAELPAGIERIEGIGRIEGIDAVAELETDEVAALAEWVHEVRVLLDREHWAAATAREQAVAVLTRARGIRGELDELQVLLGQSVTECEPLRTSSAEVSELAALVAGGGANVKKMRLRAYVLAARLEQVAEAATARLRQMSSGRYGFVHSDGLRGGNRRSGLSVDILDSYTGTQRSTKTLSGGESFMASLALALGLADVVTSESGGIALDTLFVDEGFGGLDPDSLDAVMTVLDELRQGGRVVGIVSHVEELRTRVPMQLRIHTGPQGSTLDQSEVDEIGTSDQAKRREQLAS